MRRTKFLKELREKTLPELQALEDQLRAEITRISRAKSIPHKFEAENPAKLKNLRKDLARLLTVKRERFKR